MKLHRLVANALLRSIDPAHSSGLSGKAKAFIYEYAERYRSVIDNENYDSRSNGEYWLLDHLRQMLDGPIFDVGANRGQWTTEAATCFPRSSIHSFEVVQDTFARLSANARNLPNVILNDFGLSDETTELEVFSRPDNDEISSTLPVDTMDSLTGRLPDQPWTTSKARVMRGDEYCQQAGVTRIAFLKADVEGGEYKVLRGFGPLLDDGRIGVIQFEYGAAATLAARILLMDFWRLLAPRGYLLGKLMPRSIAPWNYASTLEFKYANFIAVHSSQQAILQRLGAPAPP